MLLRKDLESKDDDKKGKDPFYIPVIALLVERVIRFKSFSVERNLGRYCLKTQCKNASF